MASIAFDHLHSIDKSRMDWKINVRVTRMWATVSPDNGTTKGFNLILLDDDNTHVHAFAYADTWRAIGKDVVEGGVYVIQDFSVRDASGNLKPVSSTYAIRFNNSTTFEPAVDNFMIPLHKFEFIDLSELYNQAILNEPTDNPEFSTDVIGVVEEFQKLKKITTKFGDRDIVRFKLSDGSVSHRVAIWGELAKSVYNDYVVGLEKPVIAILTSTKLTTYKNSVQISTLPSSKVFFNLKDDCVTDMRQRLEEEGYKSSQNDDEQSYDLPVLNVYENVTLKQLYDNAHEKTKKNIFCTFVIDKVEEYCFWWYNSCNKCHSQVSKIDKSYKCVECPRVIPVAEKRFRVLVNAMDSTFTTKVFLMDRVVKPMVCISASNLKKATENDPKMIPDIISNLAGKEISVVMEVTKENKGEDGFLFYATDMYDTSKPSTSHTNTSPPPYIPTITLSESMDHIETSRTPGSAVSVNKKIKMEK